MHIRDGSQSMKVLVFIKSEIAAGREFPTAKMICKHMGWRSGAADTLIRLSHWGYLRRVRFDGPVHHRFVLKEQP